MEEIWDVCAGGVEGMAWCGVSITVDSLLIIVEITDGDWCHDTY